MMFGETGVGVRKLCGRAREKLEVLGVDEDIGHQFEEYSKKAPKERRI
jgi:hypothetical protein